MATYDNATVMSQLNGLYKQVYSDKGIQDLVPETSKIQKLIPFEGGAERLGSTYHVPVVLSLENGFTIVGSGGGISTLNNPQSLAMGDAVVSSCEHVLRSAMSYKTASSAVAGGPQAFASATATQQQNMMKSMSRLIEIEMIYGQAANGLGLVNSINSINSTTVALTFSAAEWAAGIWSGSKNTQLDLVNSSNQAVVNTNAPLVVSAVNIATKTITVTGNATDVSAVVTLYGASGAGFLVWTGTLTKCFAGLNAMFSNVSGTLFGINAAVNELWQGNVVNVGSNLTIDGIGAGLALAQARGLDGDVEFFCAPKTWRYLNDQTAVTQRVFDKSYSTDESEVGAKSIRYYTQSGVVTIHSHIYVKEGEAYAFSADDVIRVGSAPVGKSIPGSPADNGDIFFHAPNQNAFEVRTYCDEALIPLQPAACTLFTGITNS